MTSKRTTLYIFLNLTLAILSIVFSNANDLCQNLKFNMGVDIANWLLWYGVGNIIGVGVIISWDIAYAENDQFRNNWHKALFVMLIIYLYLYMFWMMIGYGMIYRQSSISKFYVECLYKSWGMRMMIANSFVSIVLIVKWIIWDVNNRRVLAENSDNYRNIDV